MEFSETVSGTDTQNLANSEQTAFRKQVESIIGGLKSTRPEAFQPALVAAKQMLADEPAMGPATVALLLAAQQEIHPVEGSPYPALNQVFGLLLDAVFDHSEDTLQIPEILAWYDEQAAYDGVVLNRHLDRVSQHRWAEDTRILIALFSDNPSAVKQALRKVEDQFFSTQVDDLNFSFLIALKAMLDRRDSLGHVLVDEARKLLMEGIWRKQGFLNLDREDVKLLVDWYYQQEDCQPLKGYGQQVRADANRSLSSEAVTEALLRKDITDVCNQYRDCLSYLWNTFFCYEEDSLDLFENFQGMLFAALVRNRNGWLAPDYVQRGQLGYLPDLRVRLKLSAGPLSIMWVPDPRPQYRRFETMNITADTIDIRFKGYFDWYIWGYRTWEYIEGWVVGAPDQPELEQKQVLIEVGQADIIYDQSRLVDIPDYSIDTVLSMPMSRSRLPVFYHFPQTEELIGTDVTDACDQYRECARHLWQIYFRRPENRAFSFDEIDRELFATMVLSQVGRVADSPIPGVTPIPYLRVVPDTDNYPSEETFAVSRLPQTPGTTHPDDMQVIQLSSNTAELWFKGYWDYDTTQYRTWKYIQARVARAPDQPEIVGEDIVTDFFAFRIIFNPDWS